MNQETKDEVIKRIAFCIWQERCRNNDPDANNERRNWLRAKLCYYPEDMTAEETEYITT
jgi:hypothetical protein